MVFWTSLYKLLILHVICCSCLRFRCSTVAAACSVRIVLLRLDGVVRVNCDSRLLSIVYVPVLLDAVAVSLVFDRVLCAGALLLTVGLACACRLLMILFLVIILLLSGRLSCILFSVFSTLGTAGGGHPRN